MGAINYNLSRRVVFDFGAARNLDRAAHDRSLFAGGTFQCVGFPTVSIFDPVAEAITGSAVAPKEGWTVRLSKHPRLGGGPLVANGKVVGVQLATRDADPTQIPAAPLDAVKKLVGAQAGPSGNADPAAVTMQVTVTHGK